MVRRVMWLSRYSYFHVMSLFLCMCLLTRSSGGANCGDWASLSPRQAIQRFDADDTNMDPCVFVADVFHHLLLPWLCYSPRAHYRPPKTRRHSPPTVASILADTAWHTSDRQAPCRSSVVFFGAAGGFLERLRCDGSHALVAFVALVGRRAVVIRRSILVAAVYTFAEQTTRRRKMPKQYNPSIICLGKQSRPCVKM